YRARDARLARDVALKVLPPQYSGDDDRRHRFVREAQAVAALSHPNILALHDVGSEEDLSYAVFELVEGETLRRRLEKGPVPLRKAVEWGGQICRGLDAAHHRGIVHRDLKPENLAFAADGSIKILDFGLARFVSADETPAAAESKTVTTAGAPLGTVGYMSPEQARGQKTDARADIFSVGAILYEMVTGRRAFDGATPADTISAILHQDPPEMTTDREPVPGGLERIVRRCLEKSPDDRFQTARDLAFALESLSGSMPTERPAVTRAAFPWLVAGAFLVAASASAIFLWTARATPRLPDFKQLTFRRGMVLDARFTADGHTVAYSAIFDGNPAETFAMRLDQPEALALGLPPSRLVGLSTTGEMAVIL